jgi:hypothetical protein
MSASVRMKKKKKCWVFTVKAKQRDLVQAAGIQTMGRTTMTMMHLTAWGTTKTMTRSRTQRLPQPKRS